MKVGAAQISGGLLNVDMAVNRLLETLESAQALGIELLAFPETFIGGYPYWRGNVSVKDETELGARLYESSVGADHPCVDEIAKAVRRTGVAVVVGANERDPHLGAATMYNSALLFHPDSGYVGSHRKLVPTHTERAYWAAGGAEDLKLMPSSIGAVGALICYEHHMLPAQLALALLGEVVHCALWPGYWETLSHIADKGPGEANGNGEVDAVVRNYAISSQNYVVSANAILRDTDVPKDLRPLLGYNLAKGGSSIVNSGGRYLARPVVGEEQIVTADLEPRSRLFTKAYLDTVGHYTRWDLFDFKLDGRSLVNERHDMESQASAREGGLEDSTLNEDGVEVAIDNSTAGQRAQTDAQ